MLAFGNLDPTQYSVLIETSLINIDIDRHRYINGIIELVGKSQHGL